MYRVQSRHVYAAKIKQEPNANLFGMNMPCSTKHWKLCSFVYMDIVFIENLAHHLNIYFFTAYYVNTHNHETDVVTIGPKGSDI